MVLPTPTWQLDRGIFENHLAERVRAIRPEIKVLFVSGYTDDALIHHGVQEAELAFLRKPFTPSELASKVRSVLNDGR